jgi:hypothetical protein
VRHQTVTQHPATDRCQHPEQHRGDRIEAERECLERTRDGKSVARPASTGTRDMGQPAITARPDRADQHVPGDPTGGAGRERQHEHPEDVESMGMPAKSPLRANTKVPNGRA